MTDKSTRRSFLLGIAGVSIAGPYAAFAQDKPAGTRAANPRGVYATIDMRPADEMVRRLGAAGSDRRAAMREAQADPSAHMPQVLYALANSLAEDYAERAMYWYQLGRMRATYDALRCRDESARTGVLLGLRTLMSLPLRGALFYQRDRLVDIARKGIDFDLKDPAKYDHRWAALYGTVAASSDGANAGEVSVPESEWPAILKRVHETHLKSVQDFSSKKA
jgi:hypothetical protein